MKVVETFETAREAAPRSGLVPTMGYLHEGHLACVSALADIDAPKLISIFVNPLQFDEPADLERYPRGLERDLELAEAAGVDVAFVPDDSEMYPAEPTTRVTAGAVAEGMEGRHRPGHFDGVATVVAKLLAGLQPAAAAFGKKDAQQLAVVRSMVRDLSFPAEIIGVPTVRDADGVALSSRNVFIEDRDAARSLSAGLFAAADRVAEGEREAAVLEFAVAEAIGDAGADLEYATLADAATARPIGRLDRLCFLAVAARVGPVRLIDNVAFDADGTADRGVRLDQTSILYGRD